MIRDRSRTVFRQFRRGRNSAITRRLVIEVRATHHLDYRSAAADLRTMVALLRDKNEVGELGENPAGIVALSPPVQFQGLDASKAVSASSCPKLFLAAQGDSAASSTQSLFQLANEPKHIVMLTGSAHGSDLLKGKEGVQAQGLVLDFLTEHAGL